MDSTKHYVSDQKTNQWIPMKPQELKAYERALEDDNASMYGMGSSYVDYGFQVANGYTFVFSIDRGGKCWIQLEDRLFHEILKPSGGNRTLDSFKNIA